MKEKWTKESENDLECQSDCDEKWEIMESKNKGYSLLVEETYWVEMETSCRIGTSKREVTEEGIRYQESWSQKEEQ
jgi:hypothetical protein